MATFYSDQLTDLRATPRKFLPPNEGGRLHARYFSFTTPTGGVAVSDVVELARIPARARIVDLNLQWEAMSSGAGTATGTFRAGSAALVTNLNMDAAGANSFAFDALTAGRDPAAGFGHVPSAEVTLTVTAGGEAWAANKKLAGTVVYVLG